ncbi:unnamed protein product [Polarella glacialis]|uniref:Uncharacterized protein n=1 Tax=Polarella glacialis TaxID=89957 RepID=A0A813GQ42_POLGL|nr:unnamed protein product [Polarella glacialis]
MPHALRKAFAASVRNADAGVKGSQLPSRIEKAILDDPGFSSQIKVVNEKTSFNRAENSFTGAGMSSMLNQPSSSAGSSAGSNNRFDEIHVLAYASDTEDEQVSTFRLNFDAKAGPMAAILVPQASGQAGPMAAIPIPQASGQAGPMAAIIGSFLRKQKEKEAEENEKKKARTRSTPWLDPASRPKHVWELISDHGDDVPMALDLGSPALLRRLGKVELEPLEVVLKYRGVKTLRDLARVSVDVNERGVLSMKARQLWDLLGIFHKDLRGALRQLFDEEGLPVGAQPAAQPASSAAVPQASGQVAGPFAPVSVRPEGTLMTEAELVDRIREGLRLGVATPPPATDETGTGETEGSGGGSGPARELGSEEVAAAVCPKRRGLEKKLAARTRYHELRNLNSAWIYERYGLEARMVPQRVEKWSYGSLARKLNFSGCQVLLVDAEGHDASILRSMLHHCRNSAHELPELIQFETRGHCDNIEGSRAEWDVIHSLEAAGYVLIAYSHHDTYLVHGLALKREERLQQWVSGWACDRCKHKNRFPYSGGKSGNWCKSCCES